MPAQTDFKISFSIDLGPFVSGLKAMLSLTQTAAQQMAPLLNMQVKTPDFGPLDQQLASIEKEMADVTAAQVGATGAAERASAADAQAAVAAGRLAGAEREKATAVDRAAGSFQRAFFVMGAVQQISQALRNTFGGLIEASNEQERAEAAYARALANRGLLTSTSIEDARAFASELQSLTGVQDEQTIATMASLTAMGLQGERLKEATKLAGDLSIVMDTDMRTAARIMADAFNGNTGMLGRYIKGLDEADIKQRGAISIIEQVRTAVGGQAEAFGKTSPGSMRIFSAAVDDAKETLGSLVKEALLPFLQLTKPLLDFFQAAPAPVQALVGTIILATAAFVALRVTGIGAILKDAIAFGATLITNMVAPLTATTAAAYGTAGALTAVQTAGLGLLAVVGLFSAFAGATAFFQSMQEEARKSAEEVQHAREETERYKESLKGRNRFEIEFDTVALRREIKELEAEGLKLSGKDKEQNDEALKFARERLAANQDFLTYLDAEDAKRQRALASTNQLVKANAELEQLKNRQKDPTLTEAQLKEVNRSIQLKEQEIDKLEKLGTVDLEKQKKIQELRRQLKADSEKFVLDSTTQTAAKQLETDEKAATLQAEVNFRRTGDEREFELTKLAITEEFAIKRIDLESRKAIESLEIEKKRLQAIGGDEAKLQIQAITLKQEEIRKTSEEQKKIVRQDTTTKTVQIDLAVPPIGSILAQQAEVERATKRFNEAVTADARESARRQLEIEKEKLERMTLSNEEYLQKRREQIEQERVLWADMHRGAMAGIDIILAGYRRAFGELLVDQRQAANTWDAIWLEMKNTALQVIKEILAEELKNQLMGILGFRGKKEEESRENAEQQDQDLKRFAAKTAAQVGIATGATVGMTAIVTGAMGTIAAAAAPAATLVSIATFGGAVAASEAAIVAAIATTQAASKPVIGFELGGRFEKGQSGFIEGQGREIIAPEATFEDIVRGEMIPKMIVWTEQFNRQRTVSALSERIIEHPVNVDNKDVVDELKSVKKSIEALELRQEIVLKESRDWQMILRQHLPKANDYLAAKEA